MSLYDEESLIEKAVNEYEAQITHFGAAFGDSRLIQISPAALVRLIEDVSQTSIVNSNRWAFLDSEVDITPYIVEYHSGRGISTEKLDDAVQAYLQATNQERVDRINAEFREKLAKVFAPELAGVPYDNQEDTVKVGGSSSE